MDKKVKMFVCMGNTDKYKDIFVRVLNEFIIEFKNKTIVDDYCVYTLDEIEKACDSKVQNEVLDTLKNAKIVLLITEEKGYQIDEKMRHFLEKVSTWCYTMPMLGKLGILVSVCNEKELLITTNYLTKLLLAWGSGVVGKIILRDDHLENTEFEVQVQQIADKIKKMRGKISYKVPDSQNDNFRINKRVITELNDDDWIKKYWKDNKYLESKDFQQLFDSKIIK